MHQGLTTALEIVALIGMQLGWTLPGMTRSSVPHARHRIDSAFQVPRIMHIRSRHGESEWKALSINQQVEFAPGLSSVCGVGSGVRSAPWGRNTDGVQR
ncbi:hypothetical protein GCM10008949_52440 [Deinococcus humi]|nr:hypothetical protein GCM10008949_52440 [Deinococcus humi]